MFLLATLLSCAPDVATAAAAEDAWAGTWAIEWARPGWRPYLFTGTLELARAGDGWTASLAFEETSAAFTPRTVEVHGGMAQIAFAAEKGSISLELFQDGSVVGGRAAWVDANGKTLIPRSPVDGARRWETLVAPGTSEPWPTAAPSQVDLPEAAVRSLVADAQRTHSGALVLVKDDRLVVAVGEDVGRPSQVTSVTKAVSSLAVPYLLAEGKWPSVDEPLGPAVGWGADDPRSAITLRHVLSHTTGLEVPEYRPWFTEARKDHHADVRAARRVEAPGMRFAYSNRAVELTSLLVASRTGEELDAWLRPRLLDPLGIEARWSSDDAGHARVHAGLVIDAVDLAKIGVLLRDDGM